MSVKEAREIIEEEQLKFLFFLKKKKIKPDMMAPVIGTSTSYVRQLIGGMAKGQAAHDNLQKLFEFTGYEGENWF